MKTTSDEPLFVLPECVRAQFEFFREAVRSLMAAKDELYGRISVAEPVESIPITQNTMPSGEVVQNQPLQIKSALDKRIVLVVAWARQSTAAALAHFFKIFSSEKAAPSPMALFTTSASPGRRKLGLKSNGLTGNCSIGNS